MSQYSEVLFFGLISGTVRLAAPLLLAATADCLVQRSGRINLGLEGIIPCAAVAAVWTSASGGGALAAIAAALAVGMLLSILHWGCCLLPRVDDLAAGVALLIFGIGLARFAGSDLAAVLPKPLPTFDVAGVQVGILLPVGIVAALLMSWIVFNTRIGLQITAIGLDADAAAHFGARTGCLRLIAAAIGGLGGGAAGACLSLWYPFGWSDNLGAGAGITAVALAFLARTVPWKAALMAVLFAFAASLGPALQAAGGTGGYHLLNVLPQIVILLIMICGLKKHWHNE